MGKIDLKNTTGVFIYDSNGDLRSATVATAIAVPGGVAYELNGFCNAERAKERLEELKKIAPDGSPLGWLRSSSGRVRCFVLPSHEFPAGTLLQYLDALEKLYFDRHPEDLVVAVRANATQS
jgi:hypothetical protein